MYVDDGGKDRKVQQLLNFYFIIRHKSATYATMDNLSGSTAAASITADISLLNQSIEHISSVITSLETLGKEKRWSQSANHDEIESFAS